MKVRDIPWAMPEIGDEELNEVIRTFKTGWLTTGKNVKKLESGLAEYLSIKNAIAVSNGTDAIDVVLKTLGIGFGDEVIIPAFSYIATASAVTYQGAIPVFVDISLDTMNILPEKIEAAISKKTKAIMYIDYGGNPAEGDKIRAIGEKIGVPVILDGAHSIGTVYEGNSTISKHEISTMSFHMAKTFTTVEGGMIFTQNDEWDREIRIRINQGESGQGKYDHILLGTNSRMSDLNAAIGLGQLKKLDLILSGRANVANLYNEFFAEYKDLIHTPFNEGDLINSYFLYPVLINNRDKVANALKEKYGIDTRISWPKPIYEQTLYSSRDNLYKKNDCPNTEKVCKKILNLPMFPSMNVDDLHYVAHSLISELKSQ